MRMKNKFMNQSLQAKICMVYIVANLLIFIVNIFLLQGINSMANEMDMVYQENLHLNELSDCLADVQNSMTEYLNTKTSDSLEDYYRNEQSYNTMVSELNDAISEKSFGRMERNIKNLSEKYLEATSQTIEAKRGRNVEKYRVRNDTATQLYDYINTYISSLNNEQFRSNSENYEELSGSFRLFETVSILVLCIVIAGNACIIVVFTGNLISPLKSLAIAADEVANENFDIDLMEITSHDEVGTVTRAFNQMVINIRQYIERLRQSMENEQNLKENELKMEAHLKDAKLKYLQAQINPHFLFNTLNAGAQLAMLENADRTYEYVQNMAEFFRYNVKKGDNIVTIRDEMELVDNYIYILNVRFSGDIHYEKEVDNELLDTAIPSMILQPIVENCVNHGITEMAGEGKIILSVYEEGEAVCISIKDNGVGISQQVIDSILEGEYHDENRSEGSNGIGMGNVIGRLKLFTNKEHVISFKCEGINRGTEVIIYLDRKGRGDIE